MDGSGRIIAGVMSGTSADGLDVALVRISERGMPMSAQLLRWHTRPYPAELRETIHRIRMGEKLPIAELGRIGRQISLCYAAGINEALIIAGLSATDLAAVAAHGQTLYHDPPTTIQWLDPALVAAEVGCPVISDFRRADCAAGGQGAPLVPFADFILFCDVKKTRVLLNIGGIANITYLPAGGGIDDLIAFDTGPGNCISDYLVRQSNSRGAGFDEGGRIAGQGKTVSAVVDRVLCDPYFSKAPPKSTDGRQMIELFASNSSTEKSLPNLLSTACAVSVRSITEAMRRFLKISPDEVLVSGGGVLNQTMMTMLRRALPECAVRTIDELGIPSAAKEAMAFALLGAATLDGIPGNVPAATGARRRVVLGSITPKP
jgi:anhydro-N-acetylmuramic acid kinase